MRREGAQQAMQDAGILFSDKLYGLSNYDFESAYHAMNSLLARRAEFTALFAMSDVIALGAIRALVSAGLRVPEDVSVLAFGDRLEADYYYPRPTAFSVLLRDQAYKTLELVNWRLLNPHALPVAVQTAVQFHEGNSFAPANPKQER